MYKECHVPVPRWGTYKYSSNGDVMDKHHQKETFLVWPYLLPVFTKRQRGVCWCKNLVMSFTSAWKTLTRPGHYAVVLPVRHLHLSLLCLSVPVYGYFWAPSWLLWIITEKWLKDKFLRAGEYPHRSYWAEMYFILLVSRQQTFPNPNQLQVLLFEHHPPPCPLAFARCAAWDF